MNGDGERGGPGKGRRRGARRQRRRRAGRGRETPATAPSARDPADPLARAASRLGIDRLYPEQQRAIAELLAGRDVLMVQPTGSGKSACYQIPSMLLPRPVVVVSPLLALLRDQHQKLLARGVPCVRLDGTVRGESRREALGKLAAGGPLLLMTTPETLETDETGEVLAKTGIGLAAVDEAHCISEWGHDFRPAYSRIGPRLRALGAPPILALTATATVPVRAAIVGSLGMREPVVIAASPHRSNLAFEVIACEGGARLRVLVRLVRRLRRPGIVYCATRREVEGVHAALRRFGVPAFPYHGKMAVAERDAAQRAFMRMGRRSVMVATSAFGLGIDKRDIRYILHFQCPASLEQYVQEAGRAGRDGRNAHCILLHDPTDRAIHEALLARSRIRPDHLYRLGRALGAWAGEGREPSIEALAVSADLGPRITAALVGQLEEAGLVDREDSRIALRAVDEPIEDRVRGLAGQFETLRVQDSRRLDAVEAYARAPGCRASFLRDYFGEEPGEACGLCDACRGRGDRPASFFAPIPRPEAASPRAGKRRRGRPRRRK